MIWLEGTSTNLDEVKTAYAALDLDEIIISVIWNVDSTKWFTGSDRITSDQAATLGITVHTDPDFMNTWVLPPNPLSQN